jgi:hypothetical protein
MKFLNFFPTFVGHFCLDPDSEYGSGSTDLIESGSNPDPDPKPWSLGIRKSRVRVCRKVVVDDYLPLGPHNQLLCSYSSNKAIQLIIQFY